MPHLIGWQPVHWSVSLLRILVARSSLDRLSHAPRSANALQTQARSYATPRGGLCDLTLRPDFACVDDRLSAGAL